MNEAMEKNIGGGWYCSHTMIKFKVERWKEDKREIEYYFE